MSVQERVNERLERRTLRRRGVGRLPDGLREWTPPEPPLERAVVLGGGGATGIAWEAGVLQGLADLGMDLREADTMIGTSAGCVVAAHARTGTDLAQSIDRLISGEHQVPTGKFTNVDGLRFLLAHSIPGDRRHGRSLLGRSALRAKTASEEEWIAAIGERLVGQPWPERRLLITAVDARSGRSVVFSRDSQVPLERAMAASCAVPNIFPPVEINGRHYVDGGVRTVTNADLATGHRRVIVIAPIPLALRRSEGPKAQLARLGDEVRKHLIVPSTASREAMGANVFDMSRARDAFAAGRADAARVEATVRDVWIQD